MTLKFSGGVFKMRHRDSADEGVGNRVAVSMHFPSRLAVLGECRDLPTGPIRSRAGGKRI